MNLWERLTSAGAAGVPIAAIDGDVRRNSDWHAVVDTGLRCSARLRSRGIHSGSRVAMLLTNSLEAIATLFGVWMAGGVVVSLPLIARGMSPEAYGRQLRELAAGAAAELVLAEERYLRILPDLAFDAERVTTFEDIVAGATKLHEPTPPEEDSLALIQFSSGTTGSPKGVALTTRAITSQLEMLSSTLAIEPRHDRGVAWLPLSHDMGLFGCLLLAWVNGLSGLITRPERFVAAPYTWLDDCAAFGATVTATPPFGLGLAARFGSRSRSAPDALRLCLVGGERLDPGPLEHAMAALADRGLKPETVTPAYGLAEATLAVTVADLSTPPRVESLDLETPARAVSSGSPPEGVTVEIDPPGPGAGAIRVKSPSLASGYVGNDEETSRRFDGDWVRTGDVGALHDGELYVLAREDDMIVVAGRNIYAEEAEGAIASETSVRAGACALLDLPGGLGRPELVVVAERREADGDARQLAKRIARVALEATGVAVDACVFLPAGVLPKTASGKIQRFRCRELARRPPPAATRIDLRHNRRLGLH